MRKLDLAGQKFWRLTLIEVVGTNKAKQRMWRCICECGKEHIASQQHITRGTTKSCGCYHKDKQTKHGMVGTKEWFAYQHAKARCKSTHPSHADYYDRGITVTFQSFEEFFAEVGRAPSAKHSLDRIDNNRGYEPGNLRWATREEQMRNTRCDNCTVLKARIAELEAKLSLTNAVL
jgi:hypothetical protein